MTEKEYDETEFWTRIQNERGCSGCVYFDKKRVGKMGFCTFGFRLEIKETEKGEICLKRKEKW